MGRSMETTEDNSARPGLSRMEEAIARVEAQEAAEEQRQRAAEISLLQLQELQLQEDAEEQRQAAANEQKAAHFKAFRKLIGHSEDPGWLSPEVMPAQVVRTKLTLFSGVNFAQYSPVRMWL